jgi:hypothetical protein
MTGYLDYLKRLAARVRARWRDTPLPPSSEDPPIGVREPRPRGPGGRSSAVAVDEPEESLFVRAHGASPRR